LNFNLYLNLKKKNCLIASFEWLHVYCSPNLVDDHISCESCFNELFEFAKYTNLFSLLYNKEESYSYRVEFFCLMQI